MKRIHIVAVAVFALSVLSGCATTCVPTFTTQYIGPPDALLIKTPVEAPPDQSTYGTLSWKERASLWESKYDTQTANVGTANRHIGSLQDWKQQNAAVFATPAVGASNAGGTHP